MPARLAAAARAGSAIAGAGLTQRPRTVRTIAARATAALALSAMIAAPAGAQPPAPTAPSAESAAARHRALLARFEAALAAQPSATRALNDWCAATGIGRLLPGGNGPVRAIRVTGPGAAPPARLRRWLRAGPTEPVGYRHVFLSCGAVQLSEAHLWYRRDLLTPAMNAKLDSTDTPFGAVAAPLAFTRAPLASRRGPGPVCAVDTILTHRALLHLPDGRPLAYVVECYDRDALPDAPQWRDLTPAILRP